MNRRWRRSRSILPPEGPAAAQAEIEHHIRELADRLEAEGFVPREALAEAWRRFGDGDAYRERLKRAERQRKRRLRRIEAWTAIRGAARQTLRTIRRQPGYAAGVALTLALGVGANAAMFGVLDRLLFQPPLHVVDHASVKRVVVERTFLGRLNRSTSMAFPDFEDLQRSGHFSQVAALFGGPFGAATLESGSDAVRIRAIQTTHDFFPLLGVSPSLGRFYGPDDDREDAPGTAVLSHEYWEGAFGGAPDGLGRTLVIDGTPYTVIGVAPEGFTGIDLAPVDVWLPIRVASAGDDCLHTLNCLWVRTVVRLRAPEAAGAAAEEATARHRATWADRIEGGYYDPAVRVAFDPLIAARGPDASTESKVARWLGGVSLVVLLIACANVANLLLARGARRRREVSLRLALGAARARVAASLVTESLLLALGGAAFAVAFAAWGGALIRRVLLPEVHFPGLLISGRLVAFAAVVALVAGVAAALGPALQSTRVDLARDLTGSTGTAARRAPLRAILTMGQAALAVVLLAGAGLFVRSVAEVRDLDLGLDIDRLALVTLETRESGVDADGLYERAADILRRIPGVASVAGTDSPFQWAFSGDLVVPGWDSMPDLPGGGPYRQLVTDGLFETVGLEVLEGRALGPRDGSGDAEVVVISRTMATTLWPDGDALGACVYTAEAGGKTVAERRERGACTTVVGVVEDASRGSLEEEPYMAFYLPIAQSTGRSVRGLYVRTTGEARELLAAVSDPLRGLDPAVRYASIRPLRDILDPQARSWTLGAAMFTIFGALALVVAAVGLYSVLAFDVAQNTREIGIKTALGAERSRLLRGVVLRGVGMAAGGVAVGVAAAAAAAPYAADLLFRVSPRDPVVLGSVAAVLLLVAVLASLLPGLRATRVDAMEALRAD